MRNDLLRTNSLEQITKQKEHQKEKLTENKKKTEIKEIEVKACIVEVNSRARIELAHIKSEKVQGTKNFLYKLAIGAMITGAVLIIASAAVVLAPALLAGAGLAGTATASGVLAVRAVLITSGIVGATAKASSVFMGLAVATYTNYAGISMYQMATANTWEERERIMYELSMLSGSMAVIGGTYINGYQMYQMGSNQIAITKTEQSDKGNGTNRDNNYVAPEGGGGVTSTIKINGKTVEFGHGARHLEGTNLDAGTVNKILANEVSKLNLGNGQFYKGQVNIEGTIIEYTSYGVSDDVVNVGTYYPKK